MDILPIIRKAYGRMQDNLSKSIYCNRFLYNTTGDIRYLREIFSGMGISNRFIETLECHRDKRMVLFGAGPFGRTIQRLFPEFEWTCYVDNEVSSGTEIQGLQVISFDELLSSWWNAYIVISTHTPSYYCTIMKQLYQAGIPEENIFSLGLELQSWIDRQYFDLGKMPHAEEEIFVDGGAFDARSTLNFIHWAGSRCKQAYLFEPNGAVHAQIGERVSRFPYCRLIPKGLWNKNTYLHFKASPSHPSESCFLEDDDCAQRGGIPVVALDDALKGVRVTFLKLDVEGAELRVLQGAQHLIESLRPKLAICLYHKHEDLWEIPKFLLECHKDYQFYMRHYMLSEYETVLYAI